MIEHNPELERLKVWRQELRREISSIRSEIEEWDCWEELTGRQVWELYREIDDLHSDIEEISEREKVIRENILRREKLAENAEEIKKMIPNYRTNYWGWE